VDLTYTPEEESFRAKVRGWIAENAPRDRDRRDTEAMRAWQGRLHEAEGYYGLLAEQEAMGFEAPVGGWGNRFLGDRCMTIAGGTTEIQKNITAERILGLPRR